MLMGGGRRRVRLTFFAAFAVVDARVEIMRGVALDSHVRTGAVEVVHGVASRSAARRVVYRFFFFA